MIEKKLQHQPHLLLIDGYGFVFRAYHSLPPLTRVDGTPVGAVLGFTNMMLKMLASHKVDYIAVVFDAGRKTFRNEIYPAYKANRPPAPDDLIPQFSIVREAATAMNVQIIEMEGYEADDIIATYARLVREKKYKLTIVSSDKDLMQLVGEDGVQMYDPMKNKVIGIKEVNEKFGVGPDKVLDVLSLMGDSSDNIPGIPGVGPKTAAELVLQFGGLDGVLKRAGEIKQNKRRETIQENADKALLSRQLVSLCDTVPLQMDHDFIPLAVREIDYNQFYEFLKLQGFKSIIAKIEGKLQNVPQGANDLFADIVGQEKATEKRNQLRKTHLIDNLNDLRQYINKYAEIKVLVIYFDVSDRLNGIAISINNTDAVYISITQEKKVEQSSLFGELVLPVGEGSGEGWGGAQVLSKEGKEILSTLSALLVARSILKIGHDLKETYKLLLKNNVVMQPFDDAMLMSYVLGAGAHGHDLKNLIEVHLPSDIYNSKCFDDKELSKMDKNQRVAAICARVFAISDLYEALKPRVFKERCLTLYETLEKPMLTSLAEMELAGICLDTKKLKGQSRVFAEKIAHLEKEIYNVSGYEFNIGSPKQLGEILFEKMRLEGGKKSKTGAYSTDVRVLTELAEQGHKIAELILEWRHLSKLKSTYTDSLPNQIGSDGRVHTHFLLASTNTGRLSSTDPNLQNIPIRTEEGNRIREAFVAAKGHQLISADYSQIELRLLASIAKIDTLKMAFRNGMDIHAVTASQMFGVPVEQVDSELRRRAKTINFGIIYGISAFGLAQRLGIGRSEAGDYIKRYFLQYPGIESYMKNTVDFARAHGYVETIFGRKCYIKGIADKNAAIRQFSERAAINAPLQGSAADIIKKAMVRLYVRLKDCGLKARLLLQVHDELILEAPDAEIERVKKIVQHEMESAANLDIPLIAGVGVGDNWREAH